MMRFMLALGRVHKSIDTWFAYLVAMSITLQETWAELDDYVPKKARHLVLGVATIVVVINKIHQRMKETSTNGN